MADKDEKAARLAAALRENLRKRKARARDSLPSSPAKAGAQSGDVPTGPRPSPGKD
ncbi:hypothetical protein GCM10009087_46760 [Sphingomonas oligophenolica]|uniref:Uncharacterized protein n=1 Tax=Sphingomonas oligophenolica TaxID=301154 RepID=A0ABU9Y9G3_9SPHN